MFFLNRGWRSWVEGWCCEEDGACGLKYLQRLYTVHSPPALCSLATCSKLLSTTHSASAVACTTEGTFVRSAEWCSTALYAHLWHTHTHFVRDTLTLLQPTDLLHVFAMTSVVADDDVDTVELYMYFSCQLKCTNKVAAV